MKKDYWFPKLVLMGGGAIIAVIVISVLLLKVITRHNRELAVPDFSGLSIPEAKKIADKSDLKLEITDSVFLPRAPRGAIFKQNPAPGAHVKKNRKIFLTINSIEPKRIAMPSLTGLSFRQAKAELISRNLNVGKLIYAEDMATNNVLSQLHQGRKIQSGKLIETESYIDLELGLSPDQNMTSIPAVVGFSYLTARDIILDNSLNIGNLSFDASVKTYADTISSVVIKQFPEPSDFLNTLYGSNVNLTLSTDRSKIPGNKAANTPK